jgi:hypothetical protein
MRLTGQRPEGRATRVGGFVHRHQGTKTIGVTGCLPAFPILRNPQDR